MRFGRFVVAAGLASALTGCDFFFDVVVPVFDSTRPTAWAAIYKHETYQQLSLESFTQRVPTLDEYTFIITAGTDDGGTRTATLSFSTTTYCESGGVAQVKYGHHTPKTETQAGGVGSTVKNGAWVGRFVRLREYADSCPSGWNPASVSLAWTGTVEDFHGNVTNHPGARLFWQP